MNEEPGRYRVCAALSGVAACICAALAAYFSFKAGCTGDAKSGVYGDPARALGIEQIAFILHVACVFIVAATAMHLRSTNRLAYAFGLACLVFVCLWLVDGNAEAYGVRACFG